MSEYRRSTEENSVNFKPDTTINRVKKALKAYEDSGLSPAEVAELAKAKAEGKLKIIPANIGDKVYLTDLSVFTVVGIRYVYGNSVLRDGWYCDIQREALYNTYPVPFENFGKIVFLTREAAEAALLEVE